MGASLTIYVLSRDRPDMLRAALDSILAQIDPHFELIVSDNSLGDAVERMMCADYPAIHYVRRAPPLEALTHFKAILQACSSDYVTLFHDDDIMEPDYVQRMRAALDMNARVGAVGCNAWVLRDDQPTRQTVMGRISAPVLITSGEALARPYIGIRGARPAPFPSYMYRREAVSGLFLDAASGGKYADVAFLMKVQQRLPILWLPNILMSYRIHASNDSGAVDPVQQMRLARYICNNTCIARHDRAMEEFRFLAYLSWWRSRRRGQGPRRRTHRIILKYLLLKGPKLLLTSGEAWRRALARIAPALRKRQPAW